MSDTIRKLSEDEAAVAKSRLEELARARRELENARALTARAEEAARDVLAALYGGYDDTVALNARTMTLYRKGEDAGSH